MLRQSRNQGRELRTFNSLRVSELIEDCRAHTATLQKLANVTSQALHECFAYEPDEPHLGKCIDAVGELLDQVLTALLAVGVTSHDVDPLDRATEIVAACEKHRRALLSARHITKATIDILRRAHLDGSSRKDEVMASLREIDGGIQTIFESLNPTTLALPTLATH